MSSESQKVEETPPVVETPVKKAKKKKVVRPKTGYNLFVADKIKEIKDVDQKEKMKHVGQLWKKASAKEKSKYTDMAAKLKTEFEEANPVEKKKSKRGLSGYNVYMKKKIKEVLKAEALASGKKKKKKKKKKNQTRKAANVAYYLIPVEFEIDGSFIGYIKFKRAISLSNKMLNFDKETISVVKSKNATGAIKAKGTLTIVGLPNEFF